MRFGKSTYDELKFEIEKVWGFIRKRDFEKAVERYAYMDELYYHLPEKNQVRIKKEIDVVYKALVAYLRVNEAYMYAEQGNLEKLREELLNLHDLAFDLYAPDMDNDVSILLDYMNKHYQFFLEVYTYKMNTKEFEKKFRQTKNAIQKGNVKVALKHYAELILAYNHLSRHLKDDKRVHLYNMVKTLYKELSIQRLMYLANEKPEKVKFDIDMDEMKIKVKERKPLPDTVQFDDRFKKLRSMIEKEEHKEAKKLAKKL